MTDLAYLSVADGAQLLRAKKLSPVEWTKALLERIAAIDEHYNAFLVVTADKALAQAKAAEAEIAKGQWRGPMHGVPYAAKDIFDIEGMANLASQVLDAPGDYKHLGKAGVEMIQSKYSLDVCLPQMLQLYEEASAPRSTSRDR